MGPPPHPQGQALPPQQSTIIIQQPATSVRGGCPSCRVSTVQDNVLEDMACISKIANTLNVVCIATIKYTTQYKLIEALGWCCL